jgi:hypothetical protein
VTSTFTESAVEDAAFEWLRGIGWSPRHGLEIAPGEPGAARTAYAQVVLEARQTLSLQVGAGTSRTT